MLPIFQNFENCSAICDFRGVNSGLVTPHNGAQQLYVVEPSQHFVEFTQFSICGVSCHHSKNVRILEFRIKDSQPVRGQVDETINHITSECNKLAQKEYKKRHDWVCKEIHWKIGKKFDIVVKEKWYEH